MITMALSALSASLLASESAVIVVCSIVQSKRGKAGFRKRGLEGFDEPVSGSAVSAMFRYISSTHARHRSLYSARSHLSLEAESHDKVEAPKLSFSTVTFLRLCHELY